MENTAKTRSDERRGMMLEGKLIKVIPVVALPQVITLLIDSFYNMADTYFVSRLGSAAMAAVGINDSLLHVIRALALAFGIGASSYISRLLGAGQDEEASRAASTTLFTAMGVVAVVAVIANIFASPIVILFGATENARPYAIQYARWIMVFAPFTAGTTCLSQSLRGEGSATFAMWGLLSGCFVNLILDPIMIWGMGMGVAGAAIATGISKMVSFTVLLLPFLRHKTVMTISLRLFTPKRELYAEIARIGIPTGLRSSMMTVSQVVTNNMAAGYGDHVLAAVAVANKSMRMVASVMMGFGQGFQPIAGYCWGAKKYDRVKTAYFYTAAIGVAIGFILGVPLYIFSKQIVGIFSGDPNMLDAGAALMQAQCLVLPLHAQSQIATGLFQATGKGINAAVLGLSRQIIALLPCVIILPLLFGLWGLTHAQAAADILAFLIAIAMVIPMIRQLDRMQKAIQ